MEWDKEGALTVGQLKAALANVPDDASVGFMMSGITGWLNKTDRVLYHREQNIVVVDDHREGGTFSDEEISSDDLERLTK